MTEMLYPHDSAAAMTGFLTRIIAAADEPDARIDDVLAFAVHEHAKSVRAKNPDAVIPMMIADAQVLGRVVDALKAGATAAKEVMDEELDSLGAHPDTGLVGEGDDAEPVWVTGPDGRRYRISRGHVETPVWDDATVVRLLVQSLRADYRVSEQIPGFLADHVAGHLGDAYAAGVADGARAARACISRSGGGWMTTKLEPLAHRLARAGDVAGAGLLEAAKLTPNLRRKQEAKFEAAKARR